MSDSLKNRKKALEEAFFAEHNARLLKDFKAKDERRARKEALAEISGIQDSALLDRLVELDIESETLAALLLIPLVEVAWADGSIHEKERNAVLEAASKKGIQEGSPAYSLLQNWLKRMPDRAILDTWKSYISELVTDMSAEERSKLKDQLLDRARNVAQAAGGLLGFNKVSDREEAMLRDLESAF